MLMRDLESIKQEAMASEHLSDLESLKPLVKTLIDSDSVFWRDMVQLQGIEVADRQVELFLEADRDTLVTAFLRHVNFVAEQDAVVAELWRTIDNEGNIYLYFYGPRGEYRPKWQAVFCKVSVYPSSRRSWLLRAYVYLNIGVHDDKSLYNWREAIGYRPSNIAKRYLRYHPVVSRQGRKQQGLQRFEEHNQRNIDEHEESHLDSKEKNSYREHTGRQSSGDTTTSTTPSANENRWTTERRSGNESSNLHSNKDQESSRDDVKDVDRVTAELHGGFRYTSQHESVYEIKETVEFGYFYLEWDRTRLVEGWRLSSMNAQSKEAFDRILGLVTGCREDLERAATEALNTRQPSANRSLGNPKQIQGATWSQLKELAILEREFSGWPFVLPKKFPHDGRPVVDDAYGDQNSEALEKKLNIQKLPPPPNLKLMNPTEFE